MNLRLSIIVPAYNAKETIQQCLESILSGCGQGVEVIVVDDGSSDGTSAVCDALRNPSVRIHRQKNLGVSAARNAGIELARGDYVMFVDADDMLEPGWFDIIAPHFEGKEDVVVFGKSSDKTRYTVDELVMSVIGASPRQNAQPEKMPVKWASSPFSRIYSCGFLKTGKIEFDPAVINGEDALFNLEAFIKADRVRFVRTSIYRYRIHGASVTHSFDDRFFASNEAYLEKLEKLLLLSGGYSPVEARSLVDFSFCRSIEVAALRAAWTGRYSERKSAARRIAEDPFVMGRMSEGASTGRNSLHERAIYSLAEHGCIGLAVEILHAALAARGRESGRERWVNI